MRTLYKSFLQGARNTRPCITGHSVCMLQERLDLLPRLLRDHPEAVQAGREHRGAVQAEYVQGSSSGRICSRSTQYGHCKLKGTREQNCILSGKDKHIYVFETSKLRHGKLHKKTAMSPEKFIYREKWKLENSLFERYQNNTVEYLT